MIPSFVAPIPGALALVGVSFEKLSVHWDIYSQVAVEKFSGLMVTGPQVHNQTVDLSAIQQVTGTSVKPNLIYEAVANLRLRKCCFWELSWVTQAIRQDRNLWETMTPLVALAGPVYNGFERRFITLRGDFGSPILADISESSIGNPKFRYLVAPQDSAVPQLGCSPKVAA